MAQSTIKAVLPCNIKKVWERGTSLTDYSWRADLDRIEVTGENTFTEYDKAGYSLRFTVTVREPCTALNSPWRMKTFREAGLEFSGTWAEKQPERKKGFILPPSIWICSRNTGRTKSWGQPGATRKNTQS